MPQGEPVFAPARAWLRALTGALTSALTTFAPPAVLREQLRLVHANAPVSFLATGVLALVLWVALAHDGNRYAMAWWNAAVWMSIALALLLAGRVRRADADGAPKLARATVALYTAYGAVWGALPWLTLPPPDPLAAAVVMCVLAGAVGGGMTFMAPIWPVFAGYASLIALSTGVRLLILPETGYVVMGVASMLYLLTLLVQARAAERAYRSMIELRFENTGLVARLRDESQAADAARAAAEEANLAKSKFLAAASHDLRQPVHAQGLFLEVLARSDLNPEQRDLLASVRAASAATGGMLDTLLDFSRIEAGVITPQIKPFRLQLLFNKLEVELASQADAKGIVFRVRETQAVALSDPALIELVLRNLVSNAIRYTETGGVLIACRARGGALALEVWDTGIGIAPEHQKEVFREFHQLGNPERDRRKGLGLGLAIAKGLADALGHALTLASRPGRGSVFRVTLPATDAPVQADQVLPPGGHVRMANLRVLVIDDDEGVRSGMQRLLQDWGAQCDVAGSIDEALTCLRVDGVKRRPDLVISDYRLREARNGAEAIATVRAAVGTAVGAALGTEVAALLVTGDTAPERLREAQATGLMLLHKPVAPGDLYRAVVQVLELPPQPVR